VIKNIDGSTNSGGIYFEQQATTKKAKQTHQLI